jgi:alkanesulfonate monooxygenase SsuD/methylene tetrahydromethanopterin reductase-like flavin-dependent oxidoreductase (luciferase family)
MWSEPYANFEGKFYNVNGAINEPKGVQKPQIPLWIGGGGEKVTLKLVAKYADAMNVTERHPDGYRHKLDVLRQHCENVGRNYDEIIKSAHHFITLVPPGEDPEKVTARTRAQMSKSSGKEVGLEEYRERVMTGGPQEVVDNLGAIKDAGIDYFVMYFRNDLTKFDTLQLFAEEVIPHLR